MKEKKFGWKLQLIGAIAIVAIILIAVIKIVIWDKSGDKTVLEEVEEGTYDYESLDMVFTVDPSILAEREDDGINTILCIGNELFTEAPGGTSILDMISEIPNTDIISLVCFNSRVTDVQNTYTEKNPSYWQAANLYDVCKALSTHDFSLQKEAVDNNTMIGQDYLDTMSSIDMEKVDTVFILYNSVDYRNYCMLYDPVDLYNTSSYEGALRASINTLKNAYPHLRIILGSPYMHSVIIGDDVQPASIYSYGNGNLSEYVMRQYNVAMECCISYEDNYFGLINEDTVNDYCNVNILNADGLKLIGTHITEYLKRRY